MMTGSLLQASLEKDVIVPHSHLVEWLPDDQVGMATSERFLETADILLYFAGVLDRKVSCNTSHLNNFTF